MKTLYKPHSDRCKNIGPDFHLGKVFALVYAQIFLCLAINFDVQAQPVTSWSPLPAGWSTSNGVTFENGSICGASNRLRFDDVDNIWVQYTFPSGKRVDKVTYRFEENDFDETILFQQRINGGWSTVQTYRGVDASGCVPSFAATISPSATAIRWYQPRHDFLDYIWLLSGLNLTVVETKGNVSGELQVTNGPYPASASSPVYVVILDANGNIVASSPAITSSLANGNYPYQISNIPEGSGYSVGVSSTNTGTPSLPLNWSSVPANGVTVIAQQTTSGKNVQLNGPDPNSDADGDGIKNGDEGGPGTDTDGDGKPDYLDKDSDNDGIPDSVEKGATALPVDTDGDSIADYRDLDSDNDGINDVREGGGPATDSNNDGRADGALDPNTGIPSSAGAGGSTNPRDTDGDGKPDYRDLDSDNDGKGDLVESGNGAAVAGDLDNDGVIDYAPANDPDKDGIMTVADGISTTWGDGSDAVARNTGPNSSDAADYINPKSDGTNNDIDSTPYKGQDGNGDGKIDDAADPDGDGIANVIDTKPAGYGGIAFVVPAPDLRPLIIMSDVGFAKPSALSKAAVLRLYNVGDQSSSATGPITVYIYMPNNKFTLTVVSEPDWQLTYTASGNYYTLTSATKTIPYGSTNFQKINLSVNAAPDVSRGKYSIQFEVGDGSGKETNNLNNSVSVEIGVSGN